MTKNIPMKRQSSIFSFLCTSSEADINPEASKAAKEVKKDLAPVVCTRSDPEPTTLAGYFQATRLEVSNETEERYPWIINAKDKNLNEPGSSDYDPSTIYIPPKQWKQFTPFEEQYWKIKCDLYDTVVFFKKGKFYELYENDAELAASYFDLKVTDRVNMKMAGVPEATVDYWTQKFLACGFKVAKVDQCENSISKEIRESQGSEKKKIIQREMSYIMSPGTTPFLVGNGMENNCLLAVSRTGEKIEAAIFFPSTSDVHHFDPFDSVDLLYDLKCRFDPCEVIIDVAFKKTKIAKCISTLFGGKVCTFVSGESTAQLLQVYLKKLNLSDKQIVRDNPSEVNTTAFGISGEAVKEISLVDYDSQDNIFKRVNYCLSPMGKRQLLKWLCMTQVTLGCLRTRQKLLLGAITLGYRFSSLIEEQLKGLTDLDRLLSSFNYPDFNSQKLSQLLVGFQKILDLDAKLVEADFPRDWTSYDFNTACETIAHVKTELQKEHKDDSGVTALKGRLEDYLREQRSVNRCNSIVFRDIGKERYLLDVPLSVSVPTDYILLSKTKTNGRYWTPPLKEMVKQLEIEEEKLRLCDDRAFIELKEKLLQYIDLFKAIVYSGATIDCIYSIKEYYERLPSPKCIPQINEVPAFLSLEDCRHPLFSPSAFVPYTLDLSSEGTSFIILTGPNMGGKSTLLKTALLAVAMAHIGLPVTAKSASMSFINQVVTRLGSGDDIVKGQSTFYKELDDVKLCLQLNSMQFVALDEIGRGTSCRDGYAIARAVMEFLKRSNNSIGIITTHYHSLAHDLAYPKIAPKTFDFIYNSGNNISFTYKLVDGVSPESFALNIVRMAGIDSSIIPDRAKAQASSNAHNNDERNKQHQMESLSQLRNWAFLKTGKVPQVQLAYSNQKAAVHPSSTPEMADSNLKRLLASKLNEPLTKTEANYIFRSLGIATSTPDSLVPPTPMRLLQKKPLTIVSTALLSVLGPYDFVLPQVQHYSL